ncbi:MAG TPA: protein kinase [Solirubrobacteraceae bacterium]|nr:protein kinase [Solirubrobacteraceae bacterium]
MPHAPDLSGRALDGRYELHAVIGEGTFGRVYRGRDRRLARPVAVKVIKPWWAEDPDWVRSFELEAQLLARVNDPGIVQIFDVGHAEEGLYYVAELVEGESLADRLRRGPLSAAEARGIAEQLCRALTRAHAQRVIHRDIKPANVLISARGQVKVGDFGVARLAEGSTDGAGATIVGTPRYMAPEQACGGPTGPATDVYGVGIVLYEMLAGRPPFTEKTAVELALRHLRDPPPSLPNGTPQALAEIVERALAKGPGDRYPSAGAMADALARAPLTEAHEAAGTAPMVAAHRLRPAPGTAPAPGARTPATAAASARTAARARTPATATATATAPDATAATALLDRDPDTVAATRVRAPTIPRQESPPTPRKPRRAILAPGFALLLLGIAVVAVALITAGSQINVPDLHGLRRASATARLRRLGLKPSFRAKHSHAPVGSAIAQNPSPGTTVSGGTTVRITLSDGPPPIPVPQLVGQPGGQARTVLSGLGLHGVLTSVPAPGVTPGIVTRESPAAESALKPGSTVTLLVAEQPRWRPLTSFAGDAGGHSVPFRILGKQWRVVYNMSYQGLCTLIFFCSGPNARVFRPSGNSTLSQFGLNTGSAQTKVFTSGPGLYEITVAPGSDTAKWSLQVEDYY